MTVRAIVMDSAFDDATISAWEYRQRLFTELQTGFQIDYLTGPEAKLPHVAQLLHNPQSRLFTGVGHGSLDGKTFYGSLWDQVFSINGVTIPLSVLQGKIVHLLSCCTGMYLGPAMVLAGCVAFFGYNERFVYIPEYAEVFWRIDSEIPRLLIEGRLSSSEILASVRTLFEKEINDMYDAGQSRVAQALHLNSQCLVGPSQTGRGIFGDGNARLDGP